MKGPKALFPAPREAIFHGVLIASVVGALVAAALLSPTRYYQLLQEDGAVEWATFWVFLFAALVAIRGVWVARQQQQPTWFIAGLALFCGFVAMEEISWGQRLLGYRAPAYFLEHNYQLELNFHNLASANLRVLALAGIFAGYGIFLPLFGRWKPAALWLRASDRRT